MHRFVLALAALTSPILSQVDWQPVPMFRTLWGQSLAFDAARQRLVLIIAFRDGRALETWEHDGSTWQPRTSMHVPPWRLGPAIAYDAARGKTVLFGGLGAIYFDDTWEWDGVDWTPCQTATRPIGRTNAAAVWDAARKRVVVFGGRSFLTLENDTWEWDGQSWHRSITANAPAARESHGMAWDALRQRAVLFGGTQGIATPGSDDTWEYDGIDWVERQPANVPAKRTSHQLAFDPVSGRTVLFGGATTLDLFAAQFFQDTWSWNGVDWIRNAQVGPEPRATFAMATDTARGSVVVVGGVDRNDHFDDTWAWNGLAWTRTFVADPHPGTRHGHGLAFDPARARTVLFGGTDWSSGEIRGETWEFEGRSWTQRTTPTAPSPRTGVRLVFDVARSRAVLFGGFGQVGGGFQHLGDTWEWDGAVWRALATGNAPSPRTDAALCCDMARQRVVLFGGQDAAGPLGDTWEWDGSVWVRSAPTRAPAARHGHGLVDDGARARVVLFGGQDAAGPLGDTWEWNGVDWTRANPAQSPSPRRGHAMAYDSDRQRVVLFGGTGAGTFDDTWEWDGANWLRRTPNRAPYERHSAALAYDSVRHRTVLYGGEEFAETWEYAPERPASYTAFGAGCAGRHGVPELAAAPFSLPWLGDTFTVRVSGLAPRTTALWIVLGFDDRSWFGQFTLPRDLAPLGMPGCALFARGDAVYTVSTVAGVGHWSVPIPLDVRVLGARFYNQAFAIEFGANPLGVITTNAAAARARAR